MTFYELYKGLEAHFPKTLSCDWDNDGIMCADELNKPVKKVLIALDVTDEVVNFAIKKGYDTIISHHPLVFKAQDRLCECGYVQRKLISLVKNGVRVMSFHTRLDAASGGVNDVIAGKVGFSRVEKTLLDPIARICELDDAMPIQVFAKKVKKTFLAPFVKYIGKRDVKQVYVVGGDGKDSIDDAIESGADTLLTGDTSYNSMLDADEKGINIVEVGHFYSENPVCEALENIVNILDDKIKTEIYTSNKIEVI